MQSKKENEGECSACQDIWNLLAVVEMLRGKYVRFELVGPIYSSKTNNLDISQPRWNKTPFFCVYR